jgi:hypothetical protein
MMLGLLIAPVFDLRIGQAGIDSLASSGPAFNTVTQLRQGGVGAGVLTPIEVLVPADKAAGDRVLSEQRTARHHGEGGALLCQGPASSDEPRRGDQRCRSGRE